MALTVSDAIQAIITQASALSPTASAENLVYLAKSLEAISDGTLPATDAIQAIVNRAQALSPASSAEDLVYLAKSIEGLATGSALADVVDTGNAQIAAVAAAGAAQIVAVVAEGAEQTGLVSTEGDTQVARVNDAGNGFATLTTAQTLTNKTITGLKETKVAVAAATVDLAAGNAFTKTITAATTLDLSNVPATGALASFVLDLTNGGAFAVTWWPGVKWPAAKAPTLTAAGRDVLGFFTHDGGVTWTGLILGMDVK